MNLITICVQREKALGKPEDEGVPWNDVPRMVTNQLVDRRAMLLEYFNFEISLEGELVSIPLLMKGYTPSLAKLPRFLMRLGPCVDWLNEENCFHTFLSELASFYTPEQLPAGGNKKDGQGDAHMDEDSNDMADSDTTLDARKEEMARVLEHVLFPAFKARLVATKGLLKGVIEVANLKGLYRVFERC